MRFENPANDNTLPFTVMSIIKSKQRSLKNKTLQYNLRKLMLNYTSSDISISPKENGIFSRERSPHFYSSIKSHFKRSEMMCSAAVPYKSAPVIDVHKHNTAFILSPPEIW